MDDDTNEDEYCCECGRPLLSCERDGCGICDRCEEELYGGGDDGER